MSRALDEGQESRHKKMDQVEVGLSGAIGGGTPLCILYSLDLHWLGLV